MLPMYQGVGAKAITGRFRTVATVVAEAGAGECDRSDNGMIKQ